MSGAVGMRGISGVVISKFPLPGGGGADRFHTTYPNWRWITFSICGLGMYLLYNTR